MVLEKDENGSFWEHMDQLRLILIRSLVVIIIAMGLSLFFYNTVFSFFTLPLTQSSLPHLSQKQPQHFFLKKERIFNPYKEEIVYSIPFDANEPSYQPSYHYSANVRDQGHGNFIIPPQGFIDKEIWTSPTNKLIILGPLEGFLVTIKTCFWIGLVGSSPIWLLFITQFIAPALTTKERRLILPFIIVSLFFLTLGFAFAFFITIPLANQYLFSFNNEIGINQWTLSHYVDYTTSLLLANGLAFELCVIFLFLVHLNILTATILINKRRHMIVASFILGALLTPPDILTQFMMAIPLIVLFEIVIAYAFLKDRLTRHRQQKIGKDLILH
jgi:sec-independent protein translocase protein TatC